MPRSLISIEELHRLLISILTPGQAPYAVGLLNGCHDAFKCVLPPGSHERFFEKGLAFRDFEVHVHYFEAIDDTIRMASIQFKRESRFPAPYLNRNRASVREIKRILDSYYGKGVAQYVPDERGGQFHYLAPATRSGSDAWEEWGSECALYDEPHSSGQTEPQYTANRNDFVIVRFNRHAMAADCATP